MKILGKKVTVIVFAGKKSYDFLLYVSYLSFCILVTFKLS